PLNAGREALDVDAAGDNVKALSRHTEAGDDVPGVRLRHRDDRRCRRGARREIVGRRLEDVVSVCGEGEWKPCLLGELARLRRRLDREVCVEEVRPETGEGLSVKTLVVEGPLEESGAREDFVTRVVRRGSDRKNENLGTA